MTPKEFSQSLYDDNDDAKHQIIAWLEERGFMAWVNEDQYGIDVQALKMGKQYVFEVEVKHNWQSEHFMFETVHYAARKSKFIDLYDDVYFVTVNSPRTHALVINIAFLDNMKMVRKQTSETSSEWFLEIPTHLFYKYSL